MRLILGIVVLLALVSTSEAKHAQKKPWHKRTGDWVLRRAADGAYIDRTGWRYYNGAWDNTCFRTLAYLPSQTACSGNS